MILNCLRTHIGRLARKTNLLLAFRENQRKVIGSVIEKNIFYRLEALPHFSQNTQDLSADQLKNVGTACYQYYSQWLLRQ